MPRATSKKKSPLKTPKKLKAKIDVARREYVRKRDSNFQGLAKCITCPTIKPVEDMSVGHLFSRINDFVSEIGGDERAVNMQCDRDNGWKSGEGAAYCLAVDEKYGKGTCAELEKKKNTRCYWGIKKLEALLDYYREKIKEL